MKVIALVDCNSFYCSCERLFRPELKNKPVVVLSNNDGCAVSRTDEAKALGIKMGEPYFKFKNLCKTHDLKVFSANFSLYTNLSDRVMRILHQIVPKVEVYSIDEAFLDLSGISDIEQTGQLIHQTILTQVGIPVGVGISTTKVLAKVANRLAKKYKKPLICLLNKKDQDEALKETSIEDVWGIGFANTHKMKSLGIKTAKDFRDYPNEVLIQKIFTKTGLQLKHELMGISVLEFNKEETAKKEIMCSRSFGSAVCEETALAQALATYTFDASVKLRAQDSFCQEISIFARTSPFKNQEQYSFYDTYRFPTPTHDSFKLIKAAHELLRKNFKTGFEYKKAGVRLSHFYQEDQCQLDLLQKVDTLKDEKLMRVIDKVNQRLGDVVVKSGAMIGKQNAYKMNRSFKSPSYLNLWGELKKFY